MTLTRSGSVRKTFQVATLAAACVFGASALHAQSTAPGSATGSKLGVINVRQAIASTSEGKQAGAELQSQFAPRQSELEGLNKQINDLRSRIDAGTGKFSQDEQARLQREGETKARQRVCGHSGYFRAEHAGSFCLDEYRCYARYRETLRSGLSGEGWRACCHDTGREASATTDNDSGTEAAAAVTFRIAFRRFRVCPPPRSCTPGRFVLRKPFLPSARS